MSTARTIVEAARNHLLEHGFLGFSMRGLARELGMTAPALYRYFPGRGELLEAVAQRSFDLLDARLIAGLRGADALDRLARVADGYLRFALAHPRDFAILALLPGAFGLDGFPESIQARDTATFRLWTDRVREAMEVGIVAEGSPEEIATLLRATAHGLISLYLRGSPGPQDDEGFERLYWTAGIRMMSGLAGPAWDPRRLPAVMMQSGIDPEVVLSREAGRMGETAAP